MNILLAEADLLMARCLSDVFVGKGYAVRWVREIAAAEHALKAEGFGLFLLDLGLPGAANSGLLEWAFQCGTPTLVITGDEYSAKRLAVRRDELFGILELPFDLHQLNQQVGSLTHTAHET
jgi:DNA-binding response OmpR family regulator